MRPGKTCHGHATDYKLFFNDFQHFLDSLLQPRHFTTANLGVGSGLLQNGLAQIVDSYSSEKHGSAGFLFNSEKSFATANTRFQLLSLSARVRAELAKGIWFVQPQFFLDYYLPTPQNFFAASFAIYAGILF